MANHLSVYQCHACGRRSIMVQGYCFSCRSKDSYRPVKVEGKGTIFSYTIVHVADEKLQHEAPYTVAVIECEEGLRLMGRLTKEDQGEASIGAAVELAEWKENVPIFKVL